VLSAGLSAGVPFSFERSMMERVLDLDHRSVRAVTQAAAAARQLATDEMGAPRSHVY
jgi:CBS domain containing-hemolysin-like protein